ncbi:sulfotransferase domain-containing protein [Mesorhizobium sp. CAU 1732]|uniref:sulfotransferase domain-containing protein n=1 Tax=Mesorhizobium sp. CAU 1732 TaxID=3140358 RepID=UPI003261CE04
MINEVEADIGTYVVSYGGSGSKLVTRLLHEGKNPEFLERAHVHWRYPPSAPASGTRFIYVFGDPRNTVISFFQRRESRHANHGFAAPANAAVPMPRFVQWALKNLQCSTTDVPEHLDLQSYLASATHDVFELEDHVRRWLDRSGDLDIAFVRYDALWENPDAVEKLIGLKAADIPPRVSRRADWTALPADQRTQMNGIYGEAVTFIDSLPDVFMGRDLLSKTA